MLRGATAALLGLAFWSPAWAAEEQALVRRDLADVLTNPWVVDHGGELDDEGRAWVAVLADSAILDRLPPAGVRARRLVPTGPPPPGASTPDGRGTQRLLESVAAAPRAGIATLGHSVQGRDVLGAWFGQPPAEGAPGLWLLGGHHGDEVAGYEMALWVAEVLASEDGPDPAVTSALDERTVWVVPFVNPDGVQAADRYNHTRVDLNRNYGWEWSGRLPLAGVAPFSEPETQALRRLGDLVRPMAGLALHSGATNIGYVWNHTEEAAPDRADLLAQADDYAGLCSTEDFYVTNGAAWYVTQGDSNDWAYARYGTWEYTVELSRKKLLDDEGVGAVLDEHEEAIMDFVLQPITPVTVLDDVTGRPIEGWVQQGEGQMRWSSAWSGRIGLPHLASATVGAWGYDDVVWDGADEVRLVPSRVSVRSAVPSQVGSMRSLVRLPGPGGWTLRRVGEDPVTVEGNGRGSAWVPAGALRPGWWTVEDADGMVYPRALGVGAESVSTWPATDGGARAFVLGDRGELVERAVGRVGEPLGDEAVYVVDALGERLLVASDPREALLVRGAACASTPQTGHLGLLPLSKGAAWARRRPEEQAGAPQQDRR